MNEYIVTAHNGVAHIAKTLVSRGKNVDTVCGLDVPLELCVLGYDEWAAADYRSPGWAMPRLGDVYLVRCHACWLRVTEQADIGDTTNYAQATVETFARCQEKHGDLLQKLADDKTGEPETGGNESAQQSCNCSWLSPKRHWWAEIASAWITFLIVAWIAGMIGMVYWTARRLME